MKERPISKPQYDEFYLEEDVRADPKKYFIEITERILAKGPVEDGKVLDVGCANGSFIHYLRHKLKNWNYIGIDIFDEFLKKAEQAVPDVEFYNYSVFDLPDEFSEGFDVITLLGVVTHFSVGDLSDLMKILRRCLKPDGVVYLFSPFNEYGIDLDVTWRHRVDVSASDWLTGHNVFCFETMSESIEKHFSQHQFIPFNIGMNLPRADDPRRSWTIRTEAADDQLTNGLKMLSNFYIIEAHA